MLTKTELVTQFEKHKSYSEGGLGRQHDNAGANHLFYSGNEMQYVASVQDKETRKMVNFNKVKPYVDAVSGFMVQLRRKAEYQARIQDNILQQQLSEYMNSLSDYARKDANLDTLESRQDKEMLIAGYGAIDTNVGYEKNPDGSVIAEVLKYSDVYWDPEAREPNLLDARWVYRVKPMALDEALKRFAGSKEEDFERYQGETADNGQAYFNPGGGNYDKIIPNGGGQREPLVAVYYYQWWELQKYYRARNPLMDLFKTNAQLAAIIAAMLEELKKEDYAETVDDIFDFVPTAQYLVIPDGMLEAVRGVFGQFDIQLDVVDYNRRCYYTAILSGKNVFQKFKSPDQQGFTIKFKTANYDEVNEFWFGMVDGLRQPMLYANKALTEMLWVIAANSKGGVMYEESAVIDPKKFEQQYATTKAAIKVADGALSGGKIQPKAAPALPTGYENIYAISNTSLAEVSGINKEFLGSSENKQVSGILEAQRINQVVSTLANYFDAISLYQIEHARLMVTFLRILAENSEGRLISIIGEDGARKYLELTKSRMVDEYDVDIAEAPLTVAQRAETAATMVGFAEKAASLGKNIFPMVIDYIPNIKASDKAKLKQALEPTPAEQQAAEQQAQQAQADAQINRQVNAALAKSQEARAMVDVARAEVEIAKLPSEIERIRADIDKVRADTTGVLAKAEQTVIESELAKTTPNVSVTI